MHLTAHDDAVRRGVDEPLHARLLGGVHQVLGAADVDAEAALPVLVGDGRAAHQVDDGRGVDDGVDAVDGRGHVVGVGDVADDRLQARIVGQRRRHAVEGPDLEAPLEQFGDQVGADEAGASGHQHAAEFSGQR